MNKVGLFIDTWYPMVDGVIKVVDNYARRLMRYCDVVVFCPETRGFRKEDDAALPYQVVRCSSVPLIGNDYERALAYHEIAESFPALRRPIDKLEEVVDNKMWPLPKYRELLFIN